MCVSVCMNACVCVCVSLLCIQCVAVSHRAMWWGVWLQSSKRNNSLPCLSTCFSERERARLCACVWVYLIRPHDCFRVIRKWKTRGGRNEVRGGKWNSPKRLRRKKGSNGNADSEETARRQRERAGQMSRGLHAFPPIHPITHLCTSSPEPGSNFSHLLLPYFFLLLFENK